MGLFDFVKNAGASLFGIKSDAEKREEKEQAIRNFVAEFDLGIEDFTIEFTGDDDDTVILGGTVQSQEAKEKLILAVGNIEGIARVDDRMEVVVPEPEAQFYTVVSGDSLSKIAKRHYGDAMKYPEIFEANKPMLSDPNKIYPGQVLRLPHLG
ncbi:MAG: peptidoglycan-binding protein LysM [Bacteroidia bacterium]|nr:peptidoglycan-binding protein LysM [Bacteroidia bacterium]